MLFQMVWSILLTVLHLETKYTHYDLKGYEIEGPVVLKKCHLNRVASAWFEKFKGCPVLDYELKGLLKDFSSPTKENF